MSDLDVSIIMPALNEAGNIEAAVTVALQGLRRTGLRGEIIVIDDGSTDGTGEIVQRIMEGEPAVRMLRHDAPGGIGAAFWDGVSRALGTAVCLLPGDNENFPTEILRYYPLLDSVDLVIPYVFEPRSRSLPRRMVSLAYRTIIQALLGRTPLRYTNGTVLYRRIVLQECELHDPSFFFQTDILVRLLRRGFLYAEVPYRLGVRATGESKAISFRSLCQLSRGFFRLAVDVYLKRSLRKPPMGSYPAGTKTAERYAEYTSDASWASSPNAHSAAHSASKAHI